MKRTPIKGRLDNFFSSLGKQLKAGQKDRGIFSEKGKAEKKSRKPGESKFQADVRRKQEARKAEKKASNTKTNKTSAGELNKTTDKEIKITTKRSVDPAASTNNSKITVPETKAKLTFKQAFAAARKAGKKTFSFNGKSYTTELAETKKKKTTTPKVKKGSSNDINQDGIDDDIQGLTKNR